MNATDLPAKDTNAWRSFALMAAGMLGVAGAGAYVAASEGGHGALRWVLISFLFLLVTLAVGVVLDWRRLDRLSRALQLMALILSVVMLVAVGVIFPDALRMMWHS
jgi:hypothetical protein